MANSRRVKIKGVRKKELTYEEIAYFQFQMGKHELRRKRQQKADDKAERRERVN